jgi:hypothetical protein
LVSRDEIYDWKNKRILSVPAIYAASYPMGTRGSFLGGKLLGVK